MESPKPYLKNDVESREQHLLVRCHSRWVARSAVLDEGGNALKQVVVESRAARILSHRLQRCCECLYLVCQVSLAF
jgi:hypothetical protein